MAWAFRGMLGGVFRGGREDANSGDSGRSCFEAGGCVLEGDAAERVNGDVGRGETGGAKFVDALAGESLLVGERLFEDGGEEDGVDLVEVRALNVGEGVAGGCDDGCGLVGGGVEAADLGGGELAGRRVVTGGP